MDRAGPGDDKHGGASDPVHGVARAAAVGGSVNSGRGQQSAARSRARGRRTGLTTITKTAAIPGGWCILASRFDHHSEDVMAKGQMRSSKEKKKGGPAPSPFTAGQSQVKTELFGKKS
jgi:hypothetical protein